MELPKRLQLAADPQPGSHLTGLQRGLKWRPTVYAAFAASLSQVYKEIQKGACLVLPFNDSMIQ